MEKDYIAFRVVGKIKFYFDINSEWNSNIENAMVFKNSEVGEFFNPNKKEYVLKTKKHLLTVEEII